jgi:manganese/zinc/iron transport system permease protein
MAIDGAFWIVLTGSLAAASCALLGTFLVLRKMSLLGDALSHAVLPGIAVAFLFSDSRAIVPMFIGAALCGLLTTLLVEAFHRRWNVQEDASIGIVFTALFALGVVLVTAYAGQVDLDQECVLYGEIAYTPWDILIWNGRDIGPRPVWILATVFVLNLLFISLLYKELKIASFDPAMAMAVGVNATLVHYLLMGMVSLTTVASFESVGAILVVAMFIVPGAAAYLWSDRLQVMLMLAAVFGVTSAWGGYWAAGIWDSSIAGAMVVVVGAIFLVSLLFSPNQGVIARLWQRARLSLQVAEDHMLLALVRRAEVEDGYRFSRDELLKAASVSRGVSRWALRALRRSGLVVRDGQEWALAPGGRQKALRLLRNHRLWETYLSDLGLPEDRVHGPADAVEHFIGRQLAAELDAEVGRPTDPQGKRIPQSED